MSTFPVNSNFGSAFAARAHILDMHNIHCMILSRYALTGTRHPTVPRIFFYYPNPTQKTCQNYRLQCSDHSPYTVFGEVLYIKTTYHTKLELEFLNSTEETNLPASLQKKLCLCCSGHHTSLSPTCPSERHCQQHHYFKTNSIHSILL